ncbi:helix-turn-helix domain-containing protein [Kitasatospora sp. NPDC050543]|uniref:helix-turn-helix domain-containing protein n=1 Tax=Kitasatospora sp. NPDC050543 TaxID=3364054 RepID=UPI003789E287
MVWSAPRGVAAPAPDDQQLRERRAVGNRLRALRRQRGLSQERLGELARMDRRTVGRLEHGTVAATIDQLTAVADALDTELRRLFDG